MTLLLIYPAVIVLLIAFIAAVHGLDKGTDEVVDVLGPILAWPIFVLIAVPLFVGSAIGWAYRRIARKS